MIMLYFRKAIEPMNMHFVTKNNHSMLWKFLKEFCTVLIRRCTLLLLRTTLRGGGGGKIWTQCTWVPDCDGGATVVHRGCVHRP